MCTAVDIVGPILGSNALLSRIQFLCQDEQSQKVLLQMTGASVSVNGMFACTAERYTCSSCDSADACLLAAKLSKHS